jgi:hypothetical protein
VLSLGPKRYVLAKPRTDGDGFEVVGGTEHSLGGSVVDPLSMAGRNSNRRHIWTFPVAEHALVRALEGGTPRLFHAPWDDGNEAPWPVLRRFQVSSPHAIRELPGTLGARPGSRIVEAQVDWRFASAEDQRRGTPRALDPGGDMSDWRDLGWRWPDDTPAQLTTTTDRQGAPLLTLAAFAGGWAIPEQPDDPGEVEVDPRLIRRVGRGGALIDALLANPVASVENHLVQYDVGDPAAFVLAEARRLGPPTFAQRYRVAPRTARAVAKGRSPGALTIRRVLEALGQLEESQGFVCALEGCEHSHPVSPRARCWCCGAHRALGSRTARGLVGHGRPRSARRGTYRRRWI